MICMCARQMCAMLSHSNEAFKIFNHLRHLDFGLHLFGHYHNNNVALPHIFNDYLCTLIKRKFLTIKKGKFYLKVFSFFSFHEMSYNHFENPQMFSRKAGTVIFELPMICHCKRQMLAKKKKRYKVCW